MNLGDRIRVEMDVDNSVRGPGGHWFTYVAYVIDRPDVIGRGQTAREAIESLKKKEAEQ